MSIAAARDGRFRRRLHWTAVLIASCAALGGRTVDAAEAPEEEVFIISSNKGQPYTQVVEAFQATLRANEGKLHRKFTFSVKSLDNHPGRLDNQAFAPEWKEARYILVNGTIASTKVVELVKPQDARKFVYCSVTDPVTVGLIGPRAAERGVEFTGVSFYLAPAERLGFVERLFPHVRSIGLIYADMPQSHSYNVWLKQSVAAIPEPHRPELHMEEVPFVHGAGGIVRMGILAGEAARRLDPQVDIFLSPNDQLGLNEAYYQTLGKVTRKPLIGIGVTDAQGEVGATASIAPSFSVMGRQCGNIMLQLMKGTPTADVPPQMPAEYEIFIHQPRAREAGANINSFVARCPHSGPVLHLSVHRGKNEKLDWSTLRCQSN